MAQTKSSFSVSGHTFDVTIEKSGHTTRASVEVSGPALNASASGVYRWINRPWGDETGNALNSALYNLKAEAEADAVKAFKIANGYERMTAKRREAFERETWPALDVARAALEYADDVCDVRCYGLRKLAKPAGRITPDYARGDGFAVFTDEPGFCWMELDDAGIVCGVSPEGEFLKVRDCDVKYANAFRIGFFDLDAIAPEAWESMPKKTVIEYTSDHAKETGASDPFSVFALAMSLCS